MVEKLYRDGNKEKVSLLKVERSGDVLSEEVRMAFPTSHTLITLGLLSLILMTKRSPAVTTLKYSCSMFGLSCLCYILLQFVRRVSAGQGRAEPAAVLPGSGPADLAQPPRRGAPHVARHEHGGLRHPQRAPPVAHPRLPALPQQGLGGWRLAAGGRRLEAASWRTPALTDPALDNQTTIS